MCDFYFVRWFVAVEQNDESLHDEINKAHVICIVYSVEDESSLDRISQHWLPLIRESVNENEQRKPVVLVGNKIDLIDYSTIDVRKANGYVDEFSCHLIIFSWLLRFNSILDIIISRGLSMGLWKILPRWKVA